MAPCALEVEAEIAGGGHESDITHASIPQNEETDLGPEGLVPAGTVPAAVDLRHDVPEVLRVGELQPGRLDVDGVGAGAGRLARRGGHLRFRARRWFPLDRLGGSDFGAVDFGLGGALGAGIGGHLVGFVTAGGPGSGGSTGRLTASGAGRRVGEGSGAATSSTA